jgi:P-type Cu2+ transporter
MTALLEAVPTEVPSPPTTELCAHCGAPSGGSSGATTPAFCCTACATAYAMIHTHGLGAYHRFSERRHVPVRASGRAFAEFDHAAFHARYVRVSDSGVAHVALALEGVHCASCVWLIERMPVLIDGVISAELDIRHSRASVTFDPAQTTLSATAQSFDALGYTPHPFRGSDQALLRQREDRAMLVRIGIAGAIATNVMLASLALYAGELSAMDAASVRLFRWICFALTIPALIWPGRVFFTSAWAALRARTVHMDVPIALALLAGAGRGAINTVSGHGPIYFDGVCALVFLLLVGRFLQARGQRAAADATEQLFALTPANAHALQADGSNLDVPADAVAIGDVIAVRVGETIPVDGVIIAGASALNRAILTGESTDVTVGVGDEVFAGTVNRSSALQLRVTASGEDRRIATILAQVEAAARRRAPVVLLADKLASRVVTAVLVLALITYLIWVQRDASAAWDHVIALLIVTCPCALALATPLAMTAAVGRAARTGVYIKGADALESLARPGILLLDKTGTLTVGEMTLDAWDGPDDVRAQVLGLEADSTHPIASAFRRAWAGVASSPATATAHAIGGGVRGVVDNAQLVIGSPAFVSAYLDTPITPIPAAQSGLTPVLVVRNGRLVATALFGDVIRSDARLALATLRRKGWHTEMLSGDDAGVCARIGQQLEFPAADIFAAMTPEMKAAHVQRMVAHEATSARPRCVVMVGDGINDAAAIASATVGIGVHGGAEASLATADVALTKPGLRALVAAICGAERTMGVIRRNIAWAFVYNSFGVALAMSGHITPLIAAIMMPISSVTIVLASWCGRTFVEEEQ